MITRLVSSKEIVAKAIADYNLQEDEIKITDIKSWLAEGMELIGSVNQMDHKVAILHIHDYQCKLPCDLQRLNSVAFSFCENGGWFPAKRTTGTFSVFDKKCNGGCCEMLLQDNVLFPLVKNMFNLTNDKQALDKLNSDDNLRKTLSTLINQYTICSINGKAPNLIGGTNFSNTVQYDVKPSYLVFNIRDGYCKISYHAIYTDEDGMPLIPDIQSYREALIYWLGTKMLYAKWIKGEIPSNIYNQIKSSWNFYRKQAYSESLMPNIDELTNIKHTWHTLIPEVDEDKTFFSTTGDRQEIYNNNYGGWSIWN